MHLRRAAAAFLTCVALLLSPAVALAVGTQADKMCNPYYEECPCGQEPNPAAKTDPKAPKCIKGKNTHGCPVGICFDDTNDSYTTGICVAANKCDAQKTDGQTPQTCQQAGTCAGTQGSGEPTQPSTQPTTETPQPQSSGGTPSLPSGGSGTPQPSETPQPNGADTNPYLNGAIKPDSSAVNDPDSLTPTNNFESQIRSAAQNPGLIQNYFGQPADPFTANAPSSGNVFQEQSYLSPQSFGNADRGSLFDQAYQQAYQNTFTQSPSTGFDNTTPLPNTTPETAPWWQAPTTFSGLNTSAGFPAPDASQLNGLGQGTTVDTAALSQAQNDLARAQSWQDKVYELSANADVGQPSGERAQFFQNDAQARVDAAQARIDSIMRGETPPPLQTPSTQTSGMTPEQVQQAIADQAYQRYTDSLPYAQRASELIQNPNNLQLGGITNDALNAAINRPNEILANTQQYIDSGGSQQLQDAMKAAQQEQGAISSFLRNDAATWKSEAGSFWDNVPKGEMDLTTRQGWLDAAKATVNLGGFAVAATGQGITSGLAATAELTGLSNPAPSQSIGDALDPTGAAVRNAVDLANVAPFAVGGAKSLINAGIDSFGTDVGTNLGRGAFGEAPLALEGPRPTEITLSPSEYSGGRFGTGGTGEAFETPLTRLSGEGTGGGFGEVRTGGATEVPSGTGGAASEGVPRLTYEAPATPAEPAPVPPGETLQPYQPTQSQIENLSRPLVQAEAPVTPVERTAIDNYNTALTEYGRVQQLVADGQVPESAPLVRSAYSDYVQAGAGMRDAGLIERPGNFDGNAFTPDTVYRADTGEVVGTRGTSFADRPSSQPYDVVAERPVETPAVEPREAPVTEPRETPAVQPRETPAAQPRETPATAPDDQFARPRQTASEPAAPSRTAPSEQVAPSRTTQPSFDTRPTTFAEKIERGVSDFFGLAKEAPPASPLTVPEARAIDAFNSAMAQRSLPIPSSATPQGAKFIATQRSDALTNAMNGLRDAGLNMRSDGPIVRPNGDIVAAPLPIQIPGFAPYGVTAPLSDAIHDDAIALNDAQGNAPSNTQTIPIEAAPAESPSAQTSAPVTNPTAASRIAQNVQTTFEKIAPIAAQDTIGLTPTPVTLAQRAGIEPAELGGTQPEGAARTPAPEPIDVQFIARPVTFDQASGFRYGGDLMTPSGFPADATFLPPAANQADFDAARANGVQVFVYPTSLGEASTVSRADTTPKYTTCQQQCTVMAAAGQRPDGKNVSILAHVLPPDFLGDPDFPERMQMIDDALTVSIQDLFRQSDPSKPVEFIINGSGNGSFAIRRETAPYDESIARWKDLIAQAADDLRAQGAAVPQYSIRVPLGANTFAAGNANVNTFVNTEDGVVTIVAPDDMIPAEYLRPPSDLLTEGQQILLSQYDNARASFDALADIKESSGILSSAYRRAGEDAAKTIKNTLNVLKAEEGLEQIPGTANFRFSDDFLDAHPKIAANLAARLTESSVSPTAPENELPQLAGAILDPAEGLTLPEAFAVRSFNSALANYAKAAASGAETSLPASEIASAYQSLRQVGVAQNAFDGSLVRQSDGTAIAVPLKNPAPGSPVYAVTVPIDPQVMEFAIGSTDSTFIAPTADLSVLNGPLSNFASAPRPFSLGKIVSSPVRAAALGAALTVIAPAPLQTLGDLAGGPLRAALTISAEASPSARDLAYLDNSVRDLGKVQQGVASWYPAAIIDTNPSLVTASGAIHNNSDFTVAMLGGAPKYAWGTRLLVKNLANGREVSVTVNSSGSQPNRQLDLSPAAAKALGVTDTGTAPVQFVVESIPTRETAGYQRKRSDLNGAGPQPPGSLTQRVAQIQSNPSSAYANAQTLPSAAQANSPQNPFVALGNAIGKALKAGAPANDKAIALVTKLRAGNQNMLGAEIAARLDLAGFKSTETYANMRELGAREIGHDDVATPEDLAKADAAIQNTLKQISAAQSVADAFVKQGLVPKGSTALKNSDGSYRVTAPNGTNYRFAQVAPATTRPLTLDPNKTYTLDQLRGWNPPQLSRFLEAAKNLPGDRFATGKMIAVDLDVVNQFYAQFKSVPEINGIGRSAAVNKAVGGVPDSDHLTGNATDWKTVGVPNEKIAALNQILQSKDLNTYLIPHGQGPHSHAGLERGPTPAESANLAITATLPAQYALTNTATNISKPVFAYSVPGTQTIPVSAVPAVSPQTPTWPATDLPQMIAFNAQYTPNLAVQWPTPVLPVPQLTLSPAAPLDVTAPVPRVERGQDLAEAYVPQPNPKGDVQKGPELAPATRDEYTYANPIYIRSLLIPPLGIRNYLPPSIIIKLNDATLDRETITFTKQELDAIQWSKMDENAYQSAKAVFEQGGAGDYRVPVPNSNISPGPQVLADGAANHTAIVLSTPGQLPIAQTIDTSAAPANAPATLPADTPGVTVTTVQGAGDQSKISKAISRAAEAIKNLDATQLADTAVKSYKKIAAAIGLGPKDSTVVPTVQRAPFDATALEGSNLSYVCAGSGSCTPKTSDAVLAAPENGRGFVQVVASDNPIRAADVEQSLKSQGITPFARAAGGFVTSSGAKTVSQDVTYSAGKLIGSKTVNPNANQGLVISNDRGDAIIVDKRDISIVQLEKLGVDTSAIKRGISRIDITKDFKTFDDIMSANKLSAFSNLLLIKDGNIQNVVSSIAEPRRLLLTMPDGSITILNSTKDQTMLGITQIAKALGATNAVNLDTGAYNEGAVAVKSGDAPYIGSTVKNQALTNIYIGIKPPTAAPLATEVPAAATAPTKVPETVQSPETSPQRAVTPPQTDSNQPSSPATAPKTEDLQKQLQDTRDGIAKAAAQRAELAKQLSAANEKIEAIQDLQESIQDAQRNTALAQKGLDTLSSLWSQPSLAEARTLANGTAAAANLGTNAADLGSGKLAGDIRRYVSLLNSMKQPANQTLGNRNAAVSQGTALLAGARDMIAQSQKKLATLGNLKQLQGTASSLTQGIKSADSQLASLRAQETKLAASLNAPASAPVVAETPIPEPQPRIASNDVTVTPPTQALDLPPRYEPVVTVSENTETIAQPSAPATAPIRTEPEEKTYTYVNSAAKSLSLPVYEGFVPNSVLKAAMSSRYNDMVTFKQGDLDSIRWDLMSGDVYNSMVQLFPGYTPPVGPSSRMKSGLTELFAPNYKRNPSPNSMEFAGQPLALDNVETAPPQTIADDAAVAKNAPQNNPSVPGPIETVSPNVSARKPEGEEPAQQTITSVENPPKLPAQPTAVQTPAKEPVETPAKQPIHIAESLPDELVAHPNQPQQLPTISESPTVPESPSVTETPVVAESPTTVETEPAAQSVASQNTAPADAQSAAKPNGVLPPPLPKPPFDWPTLSDAWLFGKTTVQSAVGTLLPGRTIKGNIGMSVVSGVIAGTYALYPAAHAVITGDFLAAPGAYADLSTFSASGVYMTSNLLQKLAWNSGYRANVRNTLARIGDILGSAGNRAQWVLSQAPEKPQSTGATPPVTTQGTASVPTANGGGGGNLPPIETGGGGGGNGGGNGSDKNLPVPANDNSAPSWLSGKLTTIGQRIGAILALGTTLSVTQDSQQSDQPKNQQTLPDATQANNPPSNGNPQPGYQARPSDLYTVKPNTDATFPPVTTQKPDNTTPKPDTTTKPPTQTSPKPNGTTPGGNVPSGKPGSAPTGGSIGGSTGGSAPTGGTNARSSSPISSLMSFLGGFLKGLGNLFKPQQQAQNPAQTNQLDVQLITSPNPALKGATTTVSWKSTNATNCTLLDASTTAVASGLPDSSYSFIAKAPTIFSVYCANQTGLSVTRSLLLNVQ